MKRGFTLIELLAVIVILAIIALIASPIIIGLIDDARKETFKDSAYGVIKAGEILYSKDLLDGTPEEVIFTYTNGVESPSVVGKKLDYKGTKPKSGSVVINSKGQIAIAIHNGVYCVEKGYSDSEVILSEKTKEECIIFVCGSELVDSRDGESYNTVQIGEQCWMAENLRYTGNGCLTNTWNSTEPHDACQSHNANWGEEILYQWGAAMNGSATEKAQGLCPNGWHIPADAEWTALETHLGGSEIAGTKLKALSPIWDGTDNYGFNAKPAGTSNNEGTLIFVGFHGGWWTSSGSGSSAWDRYQYSVDPVFYREALLQAYEKSVRCLFG